MSDLLPPSAVPGERALSQAASSRLESIAPPVRQLWNPDTCPPDKLIYLAWALSVDSWDDRWPIHIKRQMLKDSLHQHRIKGSRAAVENALAAFNAQSLLREWWQTEPKGAPHTFEVWLNTPQSQQFMPVLTVAGRETVSQTQHYDIVPSRVYQLVIHVRVLSGSETIEAGINGSSKISKTLSAGDNWQTLAVEITGRGFEGQSRITPFFAAANAHVQRLELWDLFDDEQVIINSDFTHAAGPLYGWQSVSTIESVSFGLTASIQEQVVAAINQVKPVRSHFTANTAIAGRCAINLVGIARMINHRRLELQA